MSTKTPPTTAGPTLTQEQIDDYRRDGFIHVSGVLNPQEVERYRTAARSAYDELDSLDPGNAMFRQIVQVWRTDPVLRELTLHPVLAGLATQLAGIDLRIWHDQLLIKRPHNATPTEFHTDAPYWPHAGARHQLSAWIALVDVPVERGCMSFIPGSQERQDLRAVDLTDRGDLFTAAPDLVWRPRITVPLRAGDCTFHNGHLAHTANANDTDEFRIAMVNIYTDRATTYTGRSHPCTDGLGLEVGATLPDEAFPPV
ncbi:MAG TPA: phytanoyl-CoA dioxygenase family protein [Candidatus Avipropionibacterium avicola]|uniref:Phytanoyl-CoA dioxygenase family protein n=1 Tax=Candidatus Avipropionibacterium avicola TaxID=2840701 RepID=A0A9D1H0I2_9ACTN|nr:phytanoyl-CoA dioxygenase family protein [Candidatus Avipropionibacterium avicola]